MIGLASMMACRATGPLAETPIVGGSDEQRERVREELAAFEQNVGAGRLSIPDVRFLDLEHPAAVRRYSHRVKLDEDIDPSDVGWTLRHELCHALDYQEGLVAESALFDGVVEDLFADDWDIVVHDYPSPRLRRSEAFADFCMLGALQAHAMETPCFREPAVVAELGAWLSAEVWTGFEPVDVPIDTADPAVWWSVDSVDHFTAAATEIPAGGLELAGVDGDEPVVVDLETGEPIEVDRVDIRHLPLAAEVPPGLPERLKATVSGWPEGPAAALGSMPLWYLGQSHTRLYLLDDEGRWQVAAQACQLPTYRLFSAEDRIWLAWNTGERVSWAPASGP